MATSKHKNLVPLYLVKIFLEDTDENHGLTLQEIMKCLHDEGLDIEEQTVLKIINTLEGRKEKNDDFRIHEDLEMDIKLERDVEKGDYRYRLVSRLFDLSELKLLVDAVQSSRFIPEIDTKNLIRKLQKLASREQAEELQRDVQIEGRIKADNRRLYDNHDNIDKIYKAIREKKQIRFKYFRWNMNREKIYRKNELDWNWSADKKDAQWYTVSPWHLNYNDGNYYLIAYSDNHEGKGSRPIHFRVDKMEDTEVLDTPRDESLMPDEKYIAEYSNGTFGMFGGEFRDVTLEGIGDDMANVFFDRFGLNTSLNRDKATDYLFSAQVKVAVSSQFFSWLAGLKGKIWICGPKDVRDEMIEFLSRNLDRYYKRRKITLEVEPDMEKTVTRLFGNKNTRSTCLKNNHVSIPVSVPLSPAFYYWLAGQNGKVRITGSEETINEIKKYAVQILGACSEEGQK